MRTIWRTLVGAMVLGLALSTLPNSIASISNGTRVRPSALPGAVIIVAGHNDTYGLQTNIYHVTNQAYRVFHDAGYQDEDIQYLAPSSQYPYDDGLDQVDGDATVANLDSAIADWAPTRVSPGEPLYLYMMSHGGIEYFCTDGCVESGRTTPAALDASLTQLETLANADQINVVIDTVHAGSFIDREGDAASSISKVGRVIIASTDRTHYAYASAEGAYFSDAFLVALDEKKSLWDSYLQAKTAVELAGFEQYPWLDDNGDGLANAADGQAARQRSLPVGVPAIGLNKQADRTVIHAGQTVTYGYEVTNSGNDPLTGITLSDDKCTPVSFEGGDANGNNTLDVGETWTYRCSMALNATTTNTAIAHGTHSGGGTLSTQAAVTVTVLSPAIDLVKTADRNEILAGEAVHYRYAVTNTGNATLSSVHVIDDNGTPGDARDDVTVCTEITLAPGASRTCTLDRTLTESTTNVATTHGRDTLGASVSASDSATVQVLADNYEPNDTCAQARPISSDGSVQRHTLHRQADQDWARFDAVAGTTYLVEVQVPPESPADLALQLYTRCDGLPEQGQDHAFSPGVRMQFESPISAPIYLALANGDPTVYGSEVAYQLSVRALSESPTPGVLVLVAGRLEVNDPLQSNIHHVTDTVYRLFLGRGYGDDRIYYLASQLGMDGVDAFATQANLGYAITDWARTRVGADRPLTLYMMDHGDHGTFYLDKPRGEWVAPQQLDGWLDQLESAVPGLKVNVIIEACLSGSFIQSAQSTRLAQSVSGQGRVIITSTGPWNDAYASRQGATFSDSLWDALKAGKSLYAAFQEASWAATAAHLVQTPWLDDDGDGTANEGEDGQEAARRGFTYAGTFAQESWPPYIVQATAPDEIVDGRGVLRAEVRDDEGVKLVWAVIYAPSYQAPAPGQTLVREDLPTLVLLDQGQDNFGATYTGFDEPGLYRVVIYAEDHKGLQARPVSLQVRTLWPIYLPLVAR